MSDRFEFGRNWRDFLGKLTRNQIKNARQSLEKKLEQNTLAGLRFLDVGSGSGLFSLAAKQMGADVISFDVDQDSVRATQASSPRSSGRDGPPTCSVEWRLAFMRIVENKANVQQSSI